MSFLKWYKSDAGAKFESNEGRVQVSKSHKSYKSLQKEKKMPEYELFKIEIQT